MTTKILGQSVMLQVIIATINPNPMFHSMVLIICQLSANSVNGWNVFGPPRPLTL